MIMIVSLSHMSNIFLAVAVGGPDEGFSVICGYNVKQKAIAFINECKKYEATKEAMPTLDDSDEILDAFIDRNQKWMDAHPAGWHGDCYDYDVYEIEVK